MRETGWTDKLKCAQEPTTELRSPCLWLRLLELDIANQRNFSGRGELELSLKENKKLGS